MITNNHTTFSNLIHQQVNNNHQTVTTSVPPLIHQQTFYTNNSDKQEPAKCEAAEVEKEPTVEEIEVPAEAEVPENEEPEPEIDIVISNVVCAFSVRCQLTLKDIALNGANVEYKRENGMVTMKLRKPYTTASIWSSGKITCTGATSEDQVSPSLNLHFQLLPTFSIAGESCSPSLRPRPAKAQLPRALSKLPRRECFGNVQDAVGDQDRSVLGEVQEGSQLRAGAPPGRHLQSAQSHCHTENLLHRKYDGDG